MHRGLVVLLPLAVIAGLGCTQQADIEGCPETPVLAAPKNLTLATSCIEFISFQGRDYEISCLYVHPSNRGKVLSEDGGDTRYKSARAIVGLSPSRAFLLEGDRCNRELHLIALIGELTEAERLEAGAPKGLQKRAKIVCDQSGNAKVLTPLVAVHPNGVHVIVVNQTHERVRLRGLEVEGPPGRSRQVSVVSPGEKMVSCHNAGSSKRSAPRQITILAVIKYWTAVKKLDCPAGSRVLRSSRPVVIDDDAESNRALTYPALTQILGIEYPDEDVIREGYLHASQRIFRIVRDRVPIARVFISNRQNRWTVDKSSICSGTGITVPDRYARA